MHIYIFIKDDSSDKKDDCIRASSSEVRFKKVVARERRIGQLWQASGRGSRARELQTEGKIGGGREVKCRCR